MEENAKQEILDAISLLAEQMQGLTNQTQGLTNQTQSLTGQVHGLRDEFCDFKKKTEAGFVEVKSQMVTKSYLDDKLADLRGDLVALTKKSNVKLSVLIDSLVKEGSLKRKTADLIMAMEPFSCS